MINAHYLDSGSPFLETHNYCRKISTLGDELDRFKAEKGYTHQDEVDSRLIPDLESKLAEFAKEHYHSDDEVRVFKEGNGCFDLRDSDGRWIRFHLYPDDMIIIPANVPHRFIPNGPFVVIRLFTELFKWTARYV